jgi:uroporphyrinogen-III decarboxylase
MEKTGKQLRQEREKLIMDTIALKPAARVPIIATISYFPAKYCGIPCSAAYYDFDAWYGAYKKTLTDFQPDIMYVQGFNPGKALEICNPKQIRWPGHGVEPNQGHQAIELNNLLRADEYENYMNDPSDFMFRTYAPRTTDTLSALSLFPPLSEMGGGTMGVQVLARTFSDPKVKEMIRTLNAAGREMRKWDSKVKKFNKMIKDFGYPDYFQGAAMPPYDVIANTMRGMTGTMTDIFRQPEKIEKLAEFILKRTLDRPNPAPSENGYSRMFMTNTRGDDTFMSGDQFKRFYWPTFYKLVMGLIKKGLTPCIFFEGNFTSRLEYLGEFPKGSICAYFDTTDIFRAKDILKDHICIQGNVPASLLQIGTKEEVIAYCKKLIDYCGKGGGYILSPRSSMDEVKPENLKAMIEFTKEYGKY